MNKKENFMNQLKDYTIEFKKGIKKMFKEFFNKETNKKQRANMWTFQRIIIPLITTPLILTYLIINSASLIFVSTGLVVFGAITDALDGASARKHESTSEFGKRLDQITDKWFAGIIGISVAILNPTFISVLVGELAIGTVNLGFKYKYPECSMESSLIGKFKQWPLSITLLLGLLSQAFPQLIITTNIFLALTVGMQTATAISYVNKNIKEVKELKNKDINNDDEATVTIEYENEKSYEKQIEKYIPNQTKNNRIEQRKSDKIRQRKEQYMDLKNILSDVKVDEKGTKTDGIQKSNKKN